MTGERGRLVRAATASLCAAPRGARDHPENKLNASYIVNGRYGASLNGVNTLHAV